MPSSAVPERCSRRSDSPAPSGCDCGDAARFPRTPVTPLWKTPAGINLGLGVPAGDPRVIVGGFSRCLVGYDLDAMLTPTAAPAEDLVRLGELAAGRRLLSQGGVFALSSAEWAQRWRHLQGRSASLLPDRPGPVQGR